MVPRLVEGGCLYLGGPGSIPVEAVRASRVFFHDLVLLVFIRHENCTNQPVLTQREKEKNFGLRGRPT